MHSNPFTPAGYDLRDIENKLQQKADKHEIHSQDRRLDSVEHTVRQTTADIDGLRTRCDQLEESLRRLETEYLALLNIRTEELREATAANGQFGVGA